MNKTTEENLWEEIQKDYKKLKKDIMKYFQNQDIKASIWKQIVINILNELEYELDLKKF